MNQTLLEALKASLTAASRFNPGDMVRPAAILWTDADGQWRSAVEQLRSLMPELLTLGEYDSQTRTGPAIWLRTVMEENVRTRAFPDLAWPEGAVPVIYLPDVSRQVLRAVDECPDELKPLVELQYRGTVWAQRNGKDWTLRAFLVSDDGGLGLDVAEDKLTSQAMRGALSQLTLTPVVRLQGKRLEAEDFDKLMIGDAPRDLLHWLGDPEGTRAQWDEDTWAAFCGRCRQDYGFDPEADGEIAGGELLGKREGPWAAVWARVEEAPAAYGGIADLLRKAKPKGKLIFDREAWPDETDAMEKELRGKLIEAAAMAPAEARQCLEELESQHGKRRSWVWARLGMAPLAQALAHLVTLAARTASTLAGDSADAMAKQYIEGGYLADNAVLRALDCVKTADDTAAVRAAIRCVYQPWLEDTAQHFQECVAARPLPAVTEQDGVDAEEGDCLLFVDGLRYDMGQRLAGLASVRELDTSSSWRWAAVPTVTATAKPGSSPVAGSIIGNQLGADFCPDLADGGQAVSTQRFRQLLAEGGIQCLGGAETGSPEAEGKRAWAEQGEFDKLGHDLQAGMAARVDDQIQLLLERIESLLDAGWKRVRVVTDHGWLLVPGGMDKVELPKYLVESRWSRCASIKDSSHVDLPMAGWSWNPQEVFTSAPGAHCFRASQEYAHGGISLQECLIPVLVFTSTKVSATVPVAVTELSWAGLRCRLQVSPATEGLAADLRTKPNVADSSIADPKTLDDEGRASLLVPDDSLEGTMASLVILDSAGRVISKDATTVGGDN